MQELEPMLAPLKEEFGKAGYKHRSVFDLFVARVKEYLHVAISMDPTNPSFLMRCESNPALYTKCTMLWMGSWSADSMQRVASTVFSGLGDTLPDAQREPVAKQLVKLHERLQNDPSQVTAPS